MDTLGIVFYTIAFAYIAFIIVIESRFFIRRLFSGRWPTATATIHAESLGSLGKGGRGAFFTYDFDVEGVTYAGRFALITLRDEDHGRKLLRELTDTPISIRYNPKRPKISFIVNPWETRFDGATCTQNPYWYTERREIPGEIVKLFPK